MLAKEKLIELCQVPADGKAFFRPLICKGDLSDIDIFFVGINPATPIFPDTDMDLGKYVELLYDYDKFIDYYKRHRERNGKTEFSRTRIGINSFLSWLQAQTRASIAETNVIAYPTENLQKLDEEPCFIIEKGKEIFYELLLNYTPSLLILHGKNTVETLLDIFRKHNMILDHNVDLNLSIQQMETKAPLFSFAYPNGKKCKVIACRHFMYYGTVGKSFAKFKNNVLIMLNAMNISANAVASNENYHYKIMCSPHNSTYIDAINPRVQAGYVFWFDDAGRERAAKAINLTVNQQGEWHFFNPDRGETIKFIPQHS